MVEHYEITEEKLKVLRKLINDCQEESDKLAFQAEDYLEDGNELEYSDLHDKSIELEAFANGIRKALNVFSTYSK
jgi:hypothetical protein